MVLVSEAEQPSVFSLYHCQTSGWHWQRCLLHCLGIQSGLCWGIRGCNPVWKHLTVQGIMPRLETPEAYHNEVNCTFPFIPPLCLVYSFVGSIFFLFPFGISSKNLGIETFCGDSIFLGASFIASGGWSPKRAKNSSHLLSCSSSCSMATPLTRRPCLGMTVRAPLPNGSFSNHLACSYLCLCTTVWLLQSNLPQIYPYQFKGCLKLWLHVAVEDFPQNRLLIKWWFAP